MGDDRISRRCLCNPNHGIQRRIRSARFDNIFFSVVESPAAETVPVTNASLVN